MEPRGFLTRLLECAFIFALSAWLIRTAVCYLSEVWPALTALAIIAFFYPYRLAYIQALAGYGTMVGKKRSGL